MLLELSVLSYHRLSPRQVAVKRFDSAGGTLGRSEQADWYLPDPERVVSGVHAVVHFNAAGYTIIDKSTNGLFVNRAVEPLGQGNSHILCHGDILCLGDYEISVALIDALPDSATTSDVSKIATNPRPTEQLIPGLLIDELMAPKLTARVESENSDAISVTQSPLHTKDLPSANVELDEHFLAPGAIIPDDWDNSWQTAPVAADVAPVNVVAAATSDQQTTRTASQTLNNQMSDATGNDCLQAFLRGLAVSDVGSQLQASPQWWEQLGQAFAQSLLGVLDVMRERSAVKSRFRVNQTTFQQRENNPLKFSANIDEAFHNLFARRGSSFMPANQAIAEAFADISQHEAAIIAGAQGAMSGMLMQLSPPKLEAADLGGGIVDKINPAQRHARCWARYKMLHQELQLDLQQTSKTGLNDDFIAAYEAYLKRS